MAIAASIIKVIFQILYVVNLLFAALVIVFEKRSPAATWAWLFVVFLVPYFGFIIYLLFGLDSRKHKRFGQKARDDAGLALGFSDGREAADTPPKFGQGLVNVSKLNRLAGGASPTFDNSAKLYYNGGDAFTALRDDVQAAADYVYLLYYIVRDDGAGRAFIGLLREAALRGVDVRLCVDGMGCFFTPKKFYAPLIEAGGHVATFWPPRFLRHNFRNHRKIAVIDGRVGYTGGFNIGDEYLGRSKRFGNWRDTAIRVEGGAARDLELRFIMDWNYCGIDPIAHKSEPSTNRKEGGGGTAIQVVSSGPDTKWNAVYLSYVKMMSEAAKSIYIQTPYFVPDDGVLEALRAAALSGVDVRVMIPEKPDHLFVHWASLSYVGELLSAGVRAYQYTNGFLHAKTLMMDGLAAHVGTANMDVRSFKLNFEINACLYDEALCAGLEARFIADLADCRELTAEEYDGRGRVVKIKEAIARLLSPLL